MISRRSTRRFPASSSFARALPRHRAKRRQLEGENRRKQEKWTALSFGSRMIALSLAPESGGGLVEASRHARSGENMRIPCALQAMRRARPMHLRIFRPNGPRILKGETNHVSSQREASAPCRARGIDDCCFFGRAGHRHACLGAGGNPVIRNPERGRRAPGSCRHRVSRLARQRARAQTCLGPAYRVDRCGGHRQDAGPERRGVAATSARHSNQPLPAAKARRC